LVKYLALFGILFHFNSLQAEVKNLYTPIETVVYNKSANLQQNDLSLANHLHTIYQQAKKGSISPVIIQKVTKEISKNNTFAIYAPYLLSLTSISKFQNNPGELIGFCINNQVVSEFKKLNAQIMSLCDYYVFSSSIDRLSKKTNGEEQFLKYLEQRLFKISKTNYEHLSEFIGRSRTNTIFHNKISSLITNAYLNRKIVPPSTLLTYITINEELTLFLQRYGLNRYSTESVFLSQLSEMIESINKTFDNGVHDQNELEAKIQEVVNFSHYNFNYLPKAKVIDKLNTLAKYVSRRDNYHLARSILNFVIEKVGVSYHDTVFSYLWTYLEKEDYAKAYKFITDFKLDEKIAQFDTKLKYWYSLTLLKSGKRDESMPLFKQIITEDPLSFYAIMASKNIGSEKEEFNFYHEMMKGQSFGILQDEHTKSPDTANVIRRLKAWTKIDSNPFIEIELRNFKKSFITKKSDLTSYVKISTYILNQEQNYLTTFKVIYSALSKKQIKLDEEILKSLFPSPYFDSVKRNVQGTDPLIVMSLIRQESGFNPRAQSPVGALGLMQLMPSTASRLDRKVNNNLLRSPDRNIKIGAQYLKYLLNKYDNNLVFTLSAYNAGESRINKWREMFFKNNSILHTIESIPFKETRMYVQLIMRNIFFYKLLTTPKQDALKDLHLPSAIYDVSMGGFSD
jgi:soluble lytic murein transglycosylase